MSNIFLQPCNLEKIVRIMPQVTAMLPHHCKLTLSLEYDRAFLRICQYRLSAEQICRYICIYR